jgi:hypothetical protein
VVAILNSLAQPVVGLGLLEKDREKQNKGTKQYRGRDRHEVVSHAQPRYMNFAEPA